MAKKKEDQETKITEYKGTQFYCANCFKLSEIPIIISGTWYCSKQCVGEFMKASMNFGMANMNNLLKNAFEKQKEIMRN